MNIKKDITMEELNKKIEGLKLDINKRMYVKADRIAKLLKTARLIDIKQVMIEVEEGVGLELEVNDLYELIAYQNERLRDE